jgi:transcriptional regulator with XRE-family HTH domain
MARKEITTMETTFDSEYFRYKLKQKGCKISELAKKMNISPQALNQKIQLGKLNINNIFLILEIFDEEFENMFKLEAKK